MKLYFIAVLLCCSTFCISQPIDALITVAETERIERILSADDMEGRKAFTPGIDKAAAFIASEFKKNNLKFFGKDTSYFQEFTMIKSRLLAIKGIIGSDSLTTKNVAANTTSAELHINSLKDYEVIVVRKEDNFQKTVFPVFEKDKNVLVLLDTSHANRFKSLQRFTGNAKFSSTVSQVFVLTTNLEPLSFNLHITNELTQQKLKNVVGMIPGKSKKEEYVIFGAHYDHLGTGKPNKDMDSIYNGANDDASGTTAVIMLSRYFSQLANNERSLLFVAFTAEEMGGFGSRHFSKQLDPAKVAAMVNIEMIGTESKWGANSAYVTGYEKSDLGKILQSNLEDSDFKFEPDPYPDQKLFYRSDNATLAELGVPAHTISTAKMDEEKFYHHVDDEIETLNMVNMAAIIKSIAISSRTIINGKDTPARLVKENQ